MADSAISSAEVLASPIPDLLLTIPAVQIDEAYFNEKGKLSMTIESAYSLASAYFRSVEQYLREHSEITSEKVIEAVEFALRLFNAENFTGELTTLDQMHYKQVLDRFTFFDPTLERKKGTETKEGTEKNHGQMVDDNENPPTLMESAKAGKFREAYVRRLLTTDGEMPIECVRLSGFLLCAIGLVKAAKQESGTPGQFYVPYDNIWRLRVHYRHQLCLQHRAHSLFNELANCVDTIKALPEHKRAVTHLLEIGYVQGYYHRRDLAAESFRDALKLSKLRLEESSMMGVRTRWQKEKHVQWILRAESSRPIPTLNPGPPPKIVMGEAEGHDILDYPKESNDADGTVTLTPLHPEDKAIILALCSDIKNNNPNHGITHHHMQIYVERIIADRAPTPFVIQSQILLLKARLECRRNRVQERAFMQLTELSDQFSALRTDTASTFYRTEGEFFYTVNFPSIWSLKGEYAGFSYDEGLFKTALDCYEQIQDWENIISCCKKLDKRRRAEFLARDLIEDDPMNPALWVALGEATREDQHLWKAWELSQHKMAAPMRALAKLALERERYEDVIKYFDEAVRINAIFGGDWFSLGFAALRLKKWSRGGEAFTRVCQIDPNDAFAWNNLASIMIREGKTRPAFNAMSQALRNNRRDWRMWQNYFYMACELKEVTEATFALNIALEIAKRNINLDEEVLNVFAEIVIAYMKGEIPGSSRDFETATVEPVHKALKSAVTDPSLSLQHVPTADLGDELLEEPDEDASSFASLKPFGFDENINDNVEDIIANDKALAESEMRKATERNIIERYKERIRGTLQKLVDNFVNDPNIYASVAQIRGFLDGRLTAFEFRLKELRCCEQKELWARDPDLFARTCLCLQRSYDDLYFVRNEVQPTNSRDHADNVTMPEKTENFNKEMFHTYLKDLKGNIKAALEVALEHLEENKNYKDLQKLSIAADKLLEIAD